MVVQDMLELLGDGCNSYETIKLRLVVRWSAAIRSLGINLGLFSGFGFNVMVNIQIWLDSFSWTVKIIIFVIYW
jgi:hypothetical protein